MKPKALVCALVATSLATAGPAFAQADNQENLDRNFQQIRRAFGPKGESGRLRHAIKIVANGIDTGTIGITGPL